MNIVCSVLDQKAKVFSAPFTSQTDATALRDFARAVQDTRAMADKFPADYELYRIGVFNEDTGIIQGEPFPTLLGRGADYIQE